MHQPVAATLPFDCKVFHKPPTQAPSIDAEKIVQIAQQGGPEASAQLARFRRDVAEKICTGPDGNRSRQTILTH